MNYRELFAGIEKKVTLVNGTKVKAINFDNGATTPPLKSVLHLINSNIDNYGPIARGTGQKGDICTDKFENARCDILEFFNLNNSDKYEVVFTKSATEGLNILSNVLIDNKDDIVLTTRMEHHANDLPWRYLANVDYIDVDSLGRIKLDEIENKLVSYCGKVGYVSITAASNVTGYVNPIHDIAKLCHKYGAKIIVDGAQIVAHREVDMLGKSSDEQIDFLTFSAHKAYAPFGSGAIIGLKEDLSKRIPFLKGGGCVKGVFDHNVIWNEMCHRLEAGTQNFFGVLAMVQALKELKTIGFCEIEEHENNIKNYLIENMKKLDKIILYGDTDNIDDRLGVICFNIENKCYEEIAQFFANEKGIALRCGKFCAHPYVDRLLGCKNDLSYIDVIEDKWDYGMIRLSLGLYNTIEEADIFLQILKEVSND